MTDTFATAQDVLNALDTAPRSTVYVGGVTVDPISWDAQTDVDGTATSTITLSLPRPLTVVANAVVEIQAGHDDFIGTAFSGRIPSWKSAMSTSGNLLTVRAVGWSSLLTYRERFDLTFDGPITLKALFDALCARRGVPAYIADDATDPTGTITITLGGNPQVSEGKVTIPAATSPLAFLRTACAPFGYRVYDTEDGIVRLSRVSGLPAGDPVVTFTEGVQILSGEASYDIGGIVNYPDIHGQTFEDEYGASIPIRAFPAAIPSNPLIPVNQGITYQDTRNSNLVTQQMAEIALSVAQIDNAAPDTPVRWEAPYAPGVSVGDPVQVDAGTVEAAGLYWLVSMDTKDNGGTATYDGYAGSGVALPAGNNLVVTRIQTGVTHLGDEVLSHYAVPSSNGTTSTTKNWNITIPDRATAVAVRFYHHGTNSQISGGVENEIEVSKLQIWPAGTTNFKEEGDNRALTSGNLSSMPEELAAKRNYSTFVVASDGTTVTNPGFWKPGAVNLSRLDAGEYILRLVSGVKNGADDFEVRLVDLHVYGVSEPVIQPQEVQ
ncbi:MAG: hypothetical protein M3Q75_13840 [Gemmatimonadota bacterium]|nr:hypothetical protein [Gemmatimonadota bacterium]